MKIFEYFITAVYLIWTPVNTCQYYDIKLLTVFFFIGLSATRTILSHNQYSNASCQLSLLSNLIFHLRIPCLFSPYLPVSKRGRPRGLSFSYSSVIMRVKVDSDFAKHDLLIVTCYPGLNLTRSISGTISLAHFRINKLSVGFFFL